MHTKCIVRRERVKSPQKTDRWQTKRGQFFDKMRIAPPPPWPQFCNWSPAALGDQLQNSWSSGHVESHSTCPDNSQLLFFLYPPLLQCNNITKWRAFLLHNDVAPSVVNRIQRWGCHGTTIVGHWRGAYNNQEGQEASSLSPPCLPPARQTERQQQQRQQQQQQQTNKQVIQNLAPLDTTISLMLRGQGGSRRWILKW